MLTYKGLCVPYSVKNHREALKEEVSSGVRGCAISSLREPGSMPDCLGMVCCNCICAPEHRDTLKEYLGMKESNIATKKQIKKLLKPGMVIRTIEGKYFLWIGGSPDTAYSLVLRSEPLRFDRVELGGACLDVLADYEIDAVFARRMTASPALSVMNIIDLLKKGGSDIPYVDVVWARPTPVKDMTVAEISKALGYEVRVVGNEKTDD